jgi:hypothetical protein
MEFRKLLIPKTFSDLVFKLAVYLVIAVSAIRLDSSRIFGDIERAHYAVSIVLGIVFGGFSTFYISNWWEVRRATGAIAGCTVDSAMHLAPYIRTSRDSPIITELRKQFDQVYPCHLYESVPLSVVPDLQCAGLVSLLSDIEESVSLLLKNLEIPDFVKFSLLPQIQSNLSTIRSSHGDVNMIQSTPYPEIYERFILVFLEIYKIFILINFNLLISTFILIFIEIFIFINFNFFRNFKNSINYLTIHKSVQNELQVLFK